MKTNIKRLFHAKTQRRKEESKGKSWVFANYDRCNLIKKGQLYKDEMV